MRKLIFAINTTIDGYCDHTLFNPDEEILQYFTDLTRSADTSIYGRKTYELMVPYWPEIAANPQHQTKADIDFALAFDAISSMVVFSKSLDKAEAKNTVVLRTDLHNEILKLKQTPGKNILTGGVDLASQIARLNLIDEYHILVHPIISGKGRRLFEGIDLAQKLALTLIRSTVFKSGCVAHRYSRG